LLFVLFILKLEIARASMVHYLWRRMIDHPALLSDGFSR
jgi:hypothetical protein